MTKYPMTKECLHMNAEWRVDPKRCESPVRIRHSLSDIRHWVFQHSSFNIRDPFVIYENCDWQIPLLNHRHLLLPVIRVRSVFAAIMLLQDMCLERRRIGPKVPSAVSHLRDRFQRNRVVQ